MSVHFDILGGLCEQNNVPFMLVTLRKYEYGAHEVKSIMVGSRALHCYVLIVFAVCVLLTV